jgi:hypothetical protein
MAPKTFLPSRSSPLTSATCHPVPMSRAFRGEGEVITLSLGGSPGRAATPPAQQHEPEHQQHHRHAPTGMRAGNLHAEQDGVNRALSLAKPSGREGGRVCPSKGCGGARGCDVGRCCHSTLVASVDDQRATQAANCISQSRNQLHRRASNPRGALGHLYNRNADVGRACRLLRHPPRTKQRYGRPYTIAEYRGGTS